MVFMEDANSERFHINLTTFNTLIKTKINVQGKRNSQCAQIYLSICVSSINTCNRIVNWTHLEKKKKKLFRQIASLYKCYIFSNKINNNFKKKFSVVHDGEFWLPGS